MPQITLQFETARALKIALELRRMDACFDAVMKSEPYPTGEPWDRIGLHRFQLRWLASALENAVKDQTPEPPKHERPKTRNTKMVWCQWQACTKALTRLQAEQSRELCGDTYCPEHRAEWTKKQAAAK